MKKLLSIILGFILTCSITVLVTAENQEYWSGLIWEDFSTGDETTTLNDWNNVAQAPWSICIDRINDPATSENYCKNLAMPNVGDINDDKLISSADARLCLRAAAKIETLDKKAAESADVNGDGKITSYDARIILRAAADLGFDFVKTVDTYVGNGFVLGKFPSGGGTAYEWSYTGDYDGLTIDQKVFDNNPIGSIGGSFDMYYIFTAEKAGTYTLTFTYRAYGSNDVADQFTLIVNVE